jgi:predicted DNA-binding WGR domain protein
MIYLTKTEPARNMARFYGLDIQPTLLGNGRS